MSSASLNVSHHESSICTPPKLSPPELDPTKIGTGPMHWVPTLDPESGPNYTLKLHHHPNWPATIQRLNHFQSARRFGSMPLETRAASRQFGPLHQIDFGRTGSNLLCLGLSDFGRTEEVDSGWGCGLWIFSLRFFISVGKWAFNKNWPIFV